MRHPDEQIRQALDEITLVDGPSLRSARVLAETVEDYRERVDELEQQLQSAEGVIAQREFGYRVQMERAEAAEERAEQADVNAPSESWIARG